MPGEGGRHRRHPFEGGAGMSDKKSRFSSLAQAVKDRTADPGRGSHFSCHSATGWRRCP